MRVYENLPQLYRIAVDELRDMNPMEAMADCNNKLVELDEAYASNEISDIEYKRVRAIYEDAFGTLGAMMAEAYMLERGYRMDDSGRYMTSDGNAIAPADCERYEKYLEAGNELAREAEYRKSSKESSTGTLGR